MSRSVFRVFLALAAGLSSLACPGASAQSGREKWEGAYRERLQWWSLQPLATAAPPGVRDAAWPRNEVDRFILAGLEARGLEPAAEADRSTLVRRLAFALTGLPPDSAALERLISDPSREGLDAWMRELLASPHFGEHWARHWLDVVHYSDTHGYEWDAPAKNAWRYRDYVVRAFNADLPVRRFLLEQIAGDLIEPRIDPSTGVNEGVIGPMALRLGERRHGDNAAAEGVTQEAIANIVDTVGKGFLATTVACAQCHDHKLDAVEQRDFYALAGVFMSTRWSVRCLDAVDPNPGIIERLRALKGGIRAELGRTWLASLDELPARIRSLALPTNPPSPSGGFPASLRGWWERAAAHRAPTRGEFERERDRRLSENRTNLVLLADFSGARAGGTSGWRWEGFGMQHGLVRHGEPVIAEEGDGALVHLLPAGRWSHVWSMKLAGALRGPLLDVETAVGLSVGFASGRHAAEAFIVDQAFHSERMQFPNVPWPAWRTVKAGDFDSLEGSLDKARRRVFLEWATKSLNNYFPPRTGYGGVKPSDEVDERSWFGVTRIYRHAPGRPPLDELTRFAPLVADAEPGHDWAARLGRLLEAGVERWIRDECDEETVLLLNDALEVGWLPNRTTPGSVLAHLVESYRDVAARLQPDRTIGSVAEWNEARDERVGIRGSYTQFGPEVPRGNVRFLGGAAPRAVPASSGRLELAAGIADDRNPLAARVFVNRVWLHLFGEGLVRTPDDFGHLGEKPSHPELLDHLAARFVSENWSLKRLVAFLVGSATWRQSGRATGPARDADPENRLWHHRPLRRLPAESLRDALLAVSGRLDPTLGGPPIEPHRVAEDPAKRLAIGPLDGLGRRSLYLRMTLMEPPRFLALFNQPIPKLTTGRRDVTSVPDQALALLNDPFVIAMARHWSEGLVRDGARSPAERVAAMILRALSRPARSDEVSRFVAFAERAAALRGAGDQGLLACQPAWQDVAHALFNLKEFNHVP